MNKLTVALSCISLIFVLSRTATSQEFQLTNSYPIATDNEGYSMAIGDLNGDGVLDVAVAEEFGGPSGNGGIAILFGNADGTFRPVIYAKSEPEPVDLVLADFNHDGHLDILTDSFFGSYTNIYVQLGNGDGTFQTPMSFPVPGLAPVVGDFNNDGNLDVALVLYIYPSTLDFNLLLGNGDGTFQTYITTTLDHGSGLGTALADFNNDGKLDAVVTGAARIFTLLGKGDGTFEVRVDPRPRAIRTDLGPLVAGDFNQDGKADVAITELIDSNIRIFIGNGDGTFQPPLPYRSLSFPQQVIAADFDGDGKQDLAVIDRYAGGVSVLLGNGDGTFGPTTTYAVGLDALNIAAADVNRDGLLDIVVASPGNVSILTNTGVPPR